MKWGDELCGVKLPDPMTGDYDGWDGGVAELEDGSWCIVGGEGHNGIPVKPIFPPKGFAGKTDAELYWQIFGGPHLPTEMLNFEYGEFSNGYDFRMGMKRLCGAADLTAAIRELQNAQVLAARLQEPA